MRVTNHHATEQAIAAFTAARGAMDLATARATTGRRLLEASDDPTAALSVLQNQGQSRAIEQYQRNIGAANSRLSLESNTLDELTNILTRAKELAMGQASDNATPTTRKASAAEANQLLAQAVALANTKQNGEYVFGGQTSTTVPYSLNTFASAFTFTVAATPPAGTRSIEIAPGQYVTTAHDGITVFGDQTSGVLQTLQSLAAALDSGSGPAVTATLAPLDTALDHTQVVSAEAGARINELDTASANHQALSVQLDADTSKLRDIDIEDAMTELASRQTAFQAAMAATARVLGMSLTDYLR
ncbi:MAG TPA: flagellar hook-associated protein FlgL [Gemmatimonadaceae bacterium]|nr:flagellar hook-associated protein FlgL [Gemmatimonadaceae bacterium]